MLTRSLRVAVVAAGLVALAPARTEAQRYVTGDSFTPVYQSAHETNVVYYTYPGRAYYAVPLVPRANFLNAHETNVYLGPSYYSGPYSYVPAYRPVPVFFQSAHETNVIYPRGY